MNTYQDNKRENIVVEPEHPVIEPIQPLQPSVTERSTGFLHSIGERIGLVSPTPDHTQFSKIPGLEQHPTFVTNYPTTINGAEHTDRILAEQRPSLTERAKDYMYGAGEWIGLVGNRETRDPTWNEAAEHAAFEKPMSEKANDKFTEAGQRVGIVDKPVYEKAQDKLTEAGQWFGLFEKPTHEKAQDKLTEAGQNIGVIEKPNYEKAQDKLTEAGQRVGVVDKPAYEKAKDKMYEAKDTTFEAAEQARLVDQKSFTEKAKDYIYGVGERTGFVSSHPDMERAKDNLNEAKAKTFEAGEQAGIVRQKSYPEMAVDRLREVGEKVGLVKSPLPTVTTEFQKVTDYTDMEGQKPIFDVRTAEEVPKTLPA